MKKKVISALVLASAALILVACGGKDKAKDSDGQDGKITLKVQSYSVDDPESAAYFAIKEAEKEYPNINFEVENTVEDGGQATKARAATGDLPDIIHLNNGLIEPFLKSKSIVQLDEYVKGEYEGKMNKQSIESSLLASDDHIYAFPFDGVAPILWYYNKEIFEKNNIPLPTNYDELVKTSEALVAKDIVPLALFGKEPWPLGAFFDSFAMKENPGGVQALSENKASIKDKEYQKAAAKIQQLVKTGFFQSGVTSTDYDTAMALFTSGKAAMFMNGVWNIPDLEKELGDKLGVFEYYPTIDAGTEKNKMTFAGGGQIGGFGVAENTKDKELTIEVASFLAEKYGEFNYAYVGNIATALDTSKVELKKPLSSLTTEVSKNMENMTYGSQLLHNLPNAKFSTIFAENMQMFLVDGDPKALEAGLE